MTTREVTRTGSRKHGRSVDKNNNISTMYLQIDRYIDR